MSSSKPPSALWKGKAKATEDFFDLNPVVTYRQLHSFNLGVKDPLRVIALCDSDAFYASCEQRRLELDPSVPLVVLQWDSLIAVNYPARKYGISRMDKVKDALKRCPELKVVHVATYREGEAEPGYWDNPDTLTHKVSLDYYRKESWKIYQLFKDGVPSGEVEKASIDEAFIDFTRPVREEIMRRYPYLAAVPHDAPDGKDSPLPHPPPILWNESSTIIPVNPSSLSDDAEDAKADHSDKETSDMEENDRQTTWHDVALFIGAELMAKIRNDIHTKLGYTTSAGIARNKFLAKLTASYRKPMSQSVLRNAAIPNYLTPMAFQKIRFLGGKLGEAIAQEYDASTVGDLLTVSLDEMQRKFGEESIWVWEILRGIDRSEVKEKPPITKSMLASKNLPQPIVKASQGHHWIRVLAAELALRLREARESMPALWPKSIVLHVRQGYDAFRSKQGPFPFIRDITVDAIAHAGDKLWKELIGPEGPQAASLKITNIQLSFSGIESMETGQRTIEGFFQKPSSSDIESTTIGSTDDVEGADSGINSTSKRKRSDSTLQHQVINSDDGKEAEVVCQQESPADLFSFACSRCGLRISLAEDVVAGLNSRDHGGAHDHQQGSDEIDATLEKLRREHDDFHFAQDLHDEGHVPARHSIRPNDSGPSSHSGTTKKRKKTDTEKPNGKNKASKGDIAKFFVKR